MNLLKYIELPHVRDYTGWRRKALIILAFPQEVIRSIHYTFKNAQIWWRNA